MKPQIITEMEAKVLRAVLHDYITTTPNRYDEISHRIGKLDVTLTVADMQCIDRPFLKWRNPHDFKDYSLRVTPTGLAYLSRYERLTSRS
jgi:hypothetical protein